MNLLREEGMEGYKNEVGRRVNDFDDQVPNIRQSFE